MFCLPVSCSVHVARESPQVNHHEAHLAVWPSLALVGILLDRKGQCPMTRLDKTKNRTLNYLSSFDTGPGRPLAQWSQVSTCTQRPCPALWTKVWACFFICTTNNSGMAHQSAVGGAYHPSPVEERAPAASLGPPPLIS